MRALPGDRQHSGLPLPSEVQTYIGAINETEHWLAHQLLKEAAGCLIRPTVKKSNDW